MNKRKVDDLLPKAYQVLADVGIAQNGKIENGYRGQIATFGAAAMSGSLLSAIAFFSAKGKSDSDRPKLLKAIRALLPQEDEQTNLFEYVKAHRDDPQVKEDVFSAAIALKLAMNLYQLTKEKKPEEVKCDEQSSLPVS
jgi:hypothetical protein